MSDEHNGIERRVKTAEALATLTERIIHLAALLQQAHDDIQRIGKTLDQHLSDSRVAETEIRQRLEVHERRLKEIERAIGDKVSKSWFTGIKAVIFQAVGLAGGILVILKALGIPL